MSQDPPKPPNPKAPKPPAKRLLEAKARGARKNAANDAQNDPAVEPEPAPTASFRAAPVDEPPPVDTRPVAPLWDLPEKGAQIPMELLDYTMVFRYQLDTENGRQVRVHCGNVPPDATGSTIRRQWGGGRYVLQARVGQRVIASRELLVDGPETANGLPFGPIGELPSGLVTLNQGDPTAAAIFSMFQMWMAAQRTDFQAMLAMQQSVTEKLASQFGASMVATHLKEQLATAQARVRVLEEDKDKALEREKEHEREKLKARYKGDRTDWVEVIGAVGEMAPAVLEALPPKLKAFLESLALDAGKQLPSGVTEHPPTG